MKGQKTNWLAFSYVGFQIAASLLFFGWVGKQIDKYFLIAPYGLVLGLLLGGWFSLYEIWKRVSSNK